MTEHRWAVDRVEGEWAVICVEHGPCWNVPVWLLPAGAREGTWLRVNAATEPDGTRVLRIGLDPQTTEVKLAEARALQRRLRGHDPGGDLKL